MNWTTVLDSVKAQVAVQSGLPTYWKNQTQGYKEPSAWVLLEVLDCVTLGTDDYRRDEHMVESRVGQRKLTIRAWCETFRQTHAYAARAYLENLSTRLGFTSVVDALDAANLALIDVSKVAAADIGRDGRVVSAGYVDVILGHATVETDSDHALGTIAGVGVTGLGPTGPDEYVIPSDYPVPTEP